MPETNTSNSNGRSPDRRKLVAVVYADMVGYSRLIGLDDAGTLQRLRTLRREAIDPSIDEHGDALPLPGKPSIAVLAFTNMSGDPDQEYLSDGIADNIITDLSRSRSLFVIARNSSFSYKGHAMGVKQVPASWVCGTSWKAAFGAAPNGCVSMPNLLMRRQATTFGPSVMIAV